MNYQQQTKLKGTKWNREFRSDEKRAAFCYD